jgi:antitoxin (DNA-binding transcriptional repressor) of toxin-antitoxin stability system
MMRETEILTATEASRAFSDVLHRVCYGGESFVIKKGSRLMARIVPVGPVHEPEVIEAAGEQPIAAQKPAMESENQIYKSFFSEASPANASPLTHDEAEYFQSVIEELRKPALTDL